MVTIAASIFLTPATPGPAELAQLLEARAVEALLLPDHTHIPVGDVDGHPGKLGALPDEYGQLYDPLICAAAAATATTRLRVGTAVCLLNQRDPIVVAKQVASLDRLSGGRVVLGIGAGWLESEMRQHGIDPARRHAMLQERVAALSALWSETPTPFRGPTLSLAPMHCGPAPLTQPRPPILLGGSGPQAALRALAWADGWMPHTEVGGDTPLLRRIAATRAAAPDGFDITLAMSPADTTRLAAFRTAGVNRFLFLLPSRDRPSIEQRLDRIQAAARLA